MKLTWLTSYETLKFDTPDGDLHLDEYAVKGDKVYIRKVPENQGQFFLLGSDDKPFDLATEIAGKTQVNILDGQSAYYDEFRMWDRTTLRVPSKKVQYKNLEKKDSLKPIKDITEQEHSAIKVARVEKGAIL